MTRVAAIDCGTHTIRMLIAESPGTDLVRTMEVISLGAGVDRTGRISTAAIGRARRVLGEYAAQIERLGVDRVRMVATSASRDAENAAEFQSVVLATLGGPAEVISGDEEARLSFAGAIAGLPAELPGPYLVVDLGGGSTEFVVGRRTPAGRAETMDAVSVDIGCLRMTERYLLSDPPTAAEIDAASAHIEGAVDAALAVLPVEAARTMIGLAGSVTTVAAIALGLDAYRPEKVHGTAVDKATVVAVTSALLAASRRERREHPALHPGRVDVVGGGALVLRTIMRRAGFDQIIASEHDILDGIALSLLDPGADSLPAPACSPSS